MTEFTDISTFSGVGGLDMGLERAGMTTIAQCEADEWRREVLEHHWPGVERFDDVRTMYAGARGSGEPARRAAADGLRAPANGRRGEAGAGIPSGVDLLHGGFPCQDLSVAGNRAGLAGDRSGLFYEFARIAAAVRPTWLLIENVPGLLSSNEGRDFGIVLHTLAELGYGVAWRVLDARYFGVPQRRRRVFVVGHLGGDRRSALSALCESCEGSPEAGACSWQEPAAAAGTGAHETGWGDEYYVEDHVNGTLRANGAHGGPPRTDKQPLVVRASMDLSPALTAHHKRDSGQDEAMVVSHDVAAPLTRGSSKSPGVNPPGRRQEDDVNLVGQDPGVRRLTPTECERLMSWPDGHTAPPGLKAPDSRRYAACGDGVVSNVAEWIGRRMLAVHAANQERTDEQATGGEATGAARGARGRASGLHREAEGSRQARAAAPA